MIISKYITFNEKQIIIDKTIQYPIKLILQANSKIPEVYQVFLPNTDCKIISRTICNDKIEIEIDNCNSMQIDASLILIPNYYLIHDWSNIKLSDNYPEDIVYLGSNAIIPDNIKIKSDDVNASIKIDIINNYCLKLSIKSNIIDKIISVKYGAINNFIDVTQIFVDKFVNNNCIDIPENINYNTIFVDPCPYIIKTIIIKTNNKIININEYNTFQSINLHIPIFLKNIQLYTNYRVILDWTLLAINKLAVNDMLYFSCIKKIPKNLALFFSIYYGAGENKYLITSEFIENFYKEGEITINKDVYFNELFGDPCLDISKQIIFSDNIDNIGEYEPNQKIIKFKLNTVKYQIINENCILITNYDHQNWENIIISTNQKIQNYKIALLVPTTSINTNCKNIESGNLYQFLIKSFLNTAEPFHQYKFFVGIDRNDHIYDNKSNWDIIKNQLKTNKHNIEIEFVYLDTPKGKLSVMWNILAKKAYKEKYEYFYQIGDDIEFVNKHWVNNCIQKLQETFGIGISGLIDEHRIDILTQSFCHYTHINIFNTFFPEEYDNWYIDDWISDIYKDKYYNPNINLILLNKTGARYQIIDIGYVHSEIVKKYKDNYLIN